MNISRSRIVALFSLSACLALSMAFGCAMTPTNVAKGDAKAKITTEADIMLALGNGPSTDNFPATFASEGVNVKVYRDTEETLANYKTFDFDYTNKTNPLLEKELFGQLEKILQSRGLTRDRKNPQITISMSFFIGKKEQYTPPNTVTSTEIKEVWNSGFLGWNAMGSSQAVPVISSTTTPGYTTTTFYSNVHLNFLNHAKLLVQKGKKLEAPPMIWMGEADIEGQQSDIRNVTPLLFGEMIKEFPVATGKPQGRLVRLFRYGGLGLGFAPEDWRLVRYVEPGSVAAENGIQPGDQLLTINGKNVDTFVPVSAWYIPNPVNYRAKDPYYQQVLSNKGDKDVDVTIKKAGSKDKTVIKMRPRGDDRYIYVDPYGNPLQKTAEPSK